MTASGQDTTKCLLRKQIDIDNSAYLDALTYRDLYTDASNTIDTARLFIIQQHGVIQQGQKTIDAKDEKAAFFQSQSEMRVKENKKLARWNTFWRTLAGSAIFVVGVEIIKDLR